MDERLTPDFVMVTELETLPGLKEKIYPLQPLKNAAPPFCFYIQDTDNEDEALDGETGLQHTGYKLHVVAEEYRMLSILGSQAKAALNRLQGQWWTRSDAGVVGQIRVGDATPATPGVRMFIEHVRMMQSSPDLYETEVGWYRRIYDVDFDYQTERSDST